MTFNWKKFFIGLLLVFADILVYLFLGIMMMAYDDNYDESKGEYWSLESMSNFDKAIYFSMIFWNIINVLVIAIIIFNFIKQIKNK